MLKQQPQQMSAAQIARELTEVRLECEHLRMAVRTVASRTSALYVQLEYLKKSSRVRENR